jgi:plasmid maintenance system antidote protein VapI
MDLTSEKEHWAVWTVQARRFAKRQNFADAVARMKRVRSSIEDAIDGVTDETEKVRLDAHLARANELLSELQSQYDAWRAEIAARRQHTIDSAAEEMARPLPNQAD